MNFGARLGLILASFTLVACGGFDPEYDCKQKLACEAAYETTLEACTDTNEAIYDSLEDKEKEELDDAFDACEDKTSCEYLTCVDAELLGIDTDDLSKSTLCAPCSVGTDADTCNQVYDACEDDTDCLIALASAIDDFCGDGSAGGDTCGDDYADDDELCDGTDLWGETCYSATAGTLPNGILGCNADCTFNTTRCTP